MSAERPFAERPAARAAHPSDPSPNIPPAAGASSPGCGTVLVVVVVIVSIVLIISNLTAPKPSDMMNSCMSKVAAWAGADSSEVLGYDVSNENFSGTAWDFRGSYPGGDWACGGPSKQKTPSSVMVYPGGAGSLGIPEEIFRG